MGIKEWQLLLLPTSQRLDPLRGLWGSPSLDTSTHTTYVSFWGSPCWGLPRPCTPTRRLLLAPPRPYCSREPWVKVQSQEAGRMVVHIHRETHTCMWGTPCVPKTSVSHSIYPHVLLWYLPGQEVNVSWGLQKHLLCELSLSTFPPTLLPSPFIGGCFQELCSCHLSWLVSFSISWISFLVFCESWFSVYHWLSCL